MGSDDRWPRPWVLHKYRVMHREAWQSEYGRRMRLKFRLGIKPNKWSRLREAI